MFALEISTRFLNNLHFALVITGCFKQPGSCFTDSFLPCFFPAFRRGPGNTGAGVKIINMTIAGITNGIMSDP